MSPVVLPEAEASTFFNAPLCVDLDGTLIRSDLLFETFLSVSKQNPAVLFLCVGWVWCGRSVLKAELASRAVVNFATLPYNQELLEYLRAEKAAGCRLVLATASDLRLANGVASHLGIFDQVVGSDANTNLKGQAKRALLQKLFPQGYDYIGNSSQDFPLWECAGRRLVANASPSVVRRLQAMGPLERVFEGAELPGNFARAMRLDHWSKNLLLFVPLVAAHKILNRDCILPVIGAFVAFSMTESSVYLLDDLLDIEADRLHRTKCRRPIAAGLLSIPAAVCGALGLLAVAALLCLALPVAVRWMWITYYCVAVAYSCRRKQKL